MNFDDNKMASDRDFAIMKQNFDKIMIEETNDLVDILQKMQAQKDRIQKENRDGRYDEILFKMDSNINEIETILTNVKKNSFRHHNPFIPNLQGLFRNVKKLAPDDAISPIRGSDEIAEHENFNRESEPTPSPVTTNPPSNRELPINMPSDSTSDNIPNENSDISTNLPESNMNVSPVNKTQRNSPMQSNFIFNFAKSFNLRFRKKLLRTNDIDYPKNKFHNVVAQKKCEPKNELLGSQIDIIRLLLLYLMLRPNCKYSSRISYLTNEQFDIFLRLDT